MDADEGADDNDDESIVSPLRVGDTIIWLNKVQLTNNNNNFITLSTAYGFMTIPVKYQFKSHATLLRKIFKMNYNTDKYPKETYFFLECLITKQTRLYQLKAMISPDKLSVTPQAFLGHYW